jgi:hypothetical protein
MKRPENDKWLDDKLSETIGSEKPRTDFEQWKQKHPKAVEMLTSRSKSKTSTIKRPHLIRSIIMKNQITKYAAVIALICTGVVAATVVGIKIHNYRVVDKNPERGYFLVSEDGLTSTNVHEADSPERAIEIADETALLRQQGKREIVSVVEIEVNGQLDSRTLSFEYKLSDGRTRNVGERDPYADYPRTLTREQREEMRQLWHKQLDTTDPEKFITTEEKQVYSIVFSFKKWRLVLSDGTEVVYSIGRLKDE